MKKTNKPVRKCHSCLLNLGDHCWLYAYPRGQWQRHGICRALGNERAYELFREWKSDSRAKTRKELRQEVFRKKKTEPHWNHFPSSAQF